MLPLAHDDNGVAEAGDQIHVMLDDEEGDAAVAAQCFDVIH